jgi:hypothetical protein
MRQWGRRSPAENGSTDLLHIIGRQHSLDHPVVQPVLARVSQRRMDYLAASFRQAGMPRLEAINRARLTYAAYVGFLQLSLQLGQPRLHHDEFEAYVTHVMDALIP